MIPKMKCLKKIVFLLLCTIFVAQVNAQQQLQNAELLRKHELLRLQRLARVSSFTGRPSLRFPRSTDYLLVDVTPGGVPIFKSPINANAAITTGVVKLQSGIMGLDLRGSGMVVGVWDAGEVDVHPELDSRVIFREDTILSQHATHVTGTILASGINASAKGMAPAAQATTHYYDNDYEEMVNSALDEETPLVISNHSYGSLTGWFRYAGVWYWTGDTTVSKKEDYRFGLYAHDAEAIDIIANLAPYYTMVWAAGNDRWEVGNGAYPPDGNEGTGYDCIIPEGVAKNNITIGAVDKVLSYTDASSVPMAFFSSWGPTDDGRIKPDLVADGVNVLSTSTGGNYLVLSGTSMATPNVTGSLLLLQELYKKLHANRIMRSATLKALAIHSAKEAGTTPGPDYRFGWGLMDAEGAANVLLKEDGLNVRIEELTLPNNGSLSFDLAPVANKKIAVTMVWTDPAATSPGAVLDSPERMLINDLDIKIVDDEGNEFFPWILDPADPTAGATKGDNFRDNVERLDIDLPEDKVYQLIVSHKGFLASPQNFSLIITHESKLNTSKTFYWIGGSGDWSDVSHWSLSTGGASANEIPTANDRVIVDDNSFAVGPEETISLDADVSCKTFTWLTERAGVLLMNGNRLTIASEMVLSSGYFTTLDGGSFEFSGEGRLQLQKGDLMKDTLIFSSGNWTIDGTLAVSRLDVRGASLTFPASPVSIRQLIADDEAAIDLNKTNINDVELCVLDNTGLDSDAAEFRIANDAVFGWTAIDFSGKIIVESIGTLSLYGDNALDSVIVNHQLSLMGANHIQFLEGNPGSTISMVENRSQQLDALDLNGAEGALVEIRSMTNSNATIIYNKHEKLCFDYLRVVDVDILSESIFNAGANSELLDANNWLAIECDNVLFPDFVVGNACAHGLTLFIDQSIGAVTTWEWNFGDPGSPSNTSDDKNVNHQYTNPGTYPVTLTVSNAEYSASYTTQIEILPTDMDNIIVQNGFVLASQQSAEAYQWYLNEQPIDQATNRTFVFNEPGSYQLLTTAGDCNYLTDPFIILGTEDDVQTFVVSPNPASEKFAVRFLTDGSHRVVMTSAIGQLQIEKEFKGIEAVLDVNRFAPGVYIIDADGRKQKVIIRR